MSKKKQQHVVPHDDGWAVKKEGSDKPTRVTDTKDKAVEIGREIAQNQETELIIHDQQGVIRERESYGNDPCPPKDKEH
jgi:uncharacterized protein YdaT